MITVKNLTKIYKNDGCQTQALKGVNLHVEEGEFLAIVGASGSGKSTLLHILGGMDEGTEGEYYFDDIEVHKLRGEALHKFRKEHVSFVFQQFALMKYYSVYENVEMPLLAKRIKKSERKKRIEAVLSEMGILHLKNKKVTHISGGEQQRCAIARALVSENPLILADEPTGALDKATGIEIMKCLKKLNENGKTILLITHDYEVAAYAKRIVTMSDGVIQETPV